MNFMTGATAQIAGTDETALQGVVKACVGESEGEK